MSIQAIADWNKPDSRAKVGQFKPAPKPKGRGQVLTDPPKRCWQVDHAWTRSVRTLHFLIDIVSCPNKKDTSHPNKVSDQHY